MNSSLTPQQLNELNLLQGGDGGDHMYKIQNSINDELNLQTNQILNSESIFWDNHYTSTQSHEPFAHVQVSPSSESTSPSFDNEMMIDSCIKKETANLDLASATAPVLALVKQETINEEELYLKRKAQNRALQRLFRERKESKLKELSTKLNKTELEKLKLEREVELLRKQNTVLSTENKVLSKTGAPPLESQTTTEFQFPINKEVFINDLISGTVHDLGKAHQYNQLIYEEQGSKMMTVGAVWDYLHDYCSNHDDVEIDILQVMNVLKGNERCHGYGPGYPIEIVQLLLRKVLEQ